MSKIHQNNVRSLVLDHHHHHRSANHHHRLWTAFSAAAFRRRIFDAVSCGGSSRFRQEFQEDDISITARSTNLESKNEKTPEKQEQEGQKQEKQKQQRKGSEKLSDLLNLADVEGESSESETKKKEEALEELKRAVKELQVEDEVKRRGAASKVRLLAKENSEARVTLAMLGAIPPLAGMLDFEDVDSQIAALYALLNLGIGNDV